MMQNLSQLASINHDVLLQKDPAKGGGGGGSPFNSHGTQSFVTTVKAGFSPRFWSGLLLALTVVAAAATTLPFFLC